MNSRKAKILAAVLTFAALTLWLLLHSKTSAPTRDITAASSPSLGLGPSPFAVSPSSASPATPTEMRPLEVEREKQIWNLGLMTPIRFYGRVVDETGKSVEGATVAVSFNDHLGAGNSKRQEFTDPNGLFSVSGRGLGLSVMVSKKGYYHLPQSDRSFGYAKGAGGGAPHSDLQDPAVFVLKKGGSGESLIRLVEQDVKIRTDGTAVELSLATGKLVPSGEGDIKVEAWIDNEKDSVNSNQPFGWHCRISVPGGGLTPRKGEFDFQAPDDGYQVNDEIDMPAALGSRWRSQLSRNYFVKLRNGDFARLELTVTVGGEHFFTVTSYLNPTPGNHNLEFDPEKAQRPGS